jgi:hypothetical protein
MFLVLCIVIFYDTKGSIINKRVGQMLNVHKVSSLSITHSEYRLMRKAFQFKFLFWEVFFIC